MRALHRRLLRLEDRFGAPSETEHMRQLQRRIEAGRRGVAAAQLETYIPWATECSDPRGMTLPETIFRGRDLAR